MPENLIHDAGNTSLISCLLSGIPHDKMSPEDMRKMLFKMEREILLQSYTFPTTTSSDGYYHLWLSDSSTETGRRQIKAKTIDRLKDKAYAHAKSIDGAGAKTFHDLFDIVQDEKLKYIKNPEKILSVKNTITRNRSEYSRFFSGTAFEQKYVIEITKKDIEDITLYNLKRYDLTKKGFLSFRGILKSILRYAFEEYLTPDNIYERVNFKKYDDMLISSIPTSERVHSDSEIDRILDAIHQKQAKSPTYLPAYALELQIVVALRRGEVPPLMWKDTENGYISINKEQLTIKKSADNPKEHFEIVNHTKTWKDRRFPITEEIQELLDRIKAAQRLSGLDSEFLFPAQTDTGVITNNTVYNLYRRICKALDIPISRECMKGPHSFRRNAITKTVNKSGGNMLMASKLYGNTPDVAENNYYTGLDLEEARQILES